MRLWRPEILWLILVLALLLSIWWLPGVSSINTDSFSVSAPGKKILYQALRRLDDNVQRSRDRLIPHPGHADRLLILGPARNPTAAEWSELQSEVLSGGTLIFAGALHSSHVDLPQFGASIRGFTKSKPAEKNEEKPPKADEQAEIPHEMRAWLKQESVAETRLVKQSVTWRTTGMLELSEPDWQVLVSAESRPQVAMRRLGQGRIILSASDDIFSNAALIDPGQALLAFRILETEPTYEATWVDETLNSSGVPKVLGILFDPIFRPLTLQLILVAVLFGWMGCTWFGPVQSAHSHRRRSIVEHVRAVGVLYSRAGAGAHALRALHEFLRSELRRLYGSGFRVDNPDAVARVAQTDEAKVRRLLSQANAVEKSGQSGTATIKLLHRMSGLIARLNQDSQQKGRHGTHQS